MNYYETVLRILTVLVTCTLLLLMGCGNQPQKLNLKNAPCIRFVCIQGAVVRGDTMEKKLALIFSGDSFADGGTHIRSVLKERTVPASFFFTGNFYRNNTFDSIIRNLHSDGHYIGAHSDRHLLYNDWENRNSLLVTHDEFVEDVENNYKEMERLNISKEGAKYYLPPYEWYNKTIAEWTDSVGLQLINMTHGTLSHADYTTPEMPNYRNSNEIFTSIINYEMENPNGLNGFILLIHIGTAPERTDKFYLRLDELISELKSRGYEFSRIDQLLE